MSGSVTEYKNSAYQVTVRGVDKQIHVRLVDRVMDFELADGPYFYMARRAGDEGSIVSEWLVGASSALEGDTITIRGRLAGLELEQRFWLPADRPILEEQITLHNPTDSNIALTDLGCGLQRQITTDFGKILPELESDRIVAIPFRHRPADAPHWDNDFDMAHLITFTGREPHLDKVIGPWPEKHGYLPSKKRFSEGWAWIHGEHTLGVFKFNQDAMEFSTLAIDTDDRGALLRFGGVGMLADEPSCLRKIEPGETIGLGVTRLETVAGGFTQANYAFRSLLDENGCRFPDNYNPPVHWNELYDNAEYTLGTPGRPEGPRMTRPLTYTKALMLEEAAKAKKYHCEALYLDPGWDTDFATFLWGQAWLGDRQEFIQDVWEQHGLRVSLHCPLATWMSRDGRAVPSWPVESYRMDRDGSIIYQQTWAGGRAGSVCLGSKQYLDEAEKRLLAHCADGVVFLMFDGNWYNFGCWNPEHGHPVPYTMEDHCRANYDLARRIHDKYPGVLIEMHDMVNGGSIMRYTPVYYKYGLPGSYDENWGFELMWQPMEDIRSGRARALYYYNLGCNVPLYTHIDLRGDNEHGLVLWWYASTCRHLGIGGTHENPQVVQMHQQAMKRYRRLERFYKRGDFYGLGEEVHLHVMPEENALVVNLFNFSDESRLIGGSIGVEEMGLARDIWYVTPYSHGEGGFNRDTGTFTINRRLAPWSAQVVELYPLEMTG